MLTENSEFVRGSVSMKICRRESCRKIQKKERRGGEKSARKSGNKEGRKSAADWGAAQEIVGVPSSVSL